MAEINAVAEVTDQDELALSETQLAERSSNFDFRVIGQGLQMVEVLLKPGEKLIAESGSLCYLESDIQFETQFNDGSKPEGSWWAIFKDAVKHIMGSTSLAILHISNGGERPNRVAFSSPIPGSTIWIDLGAMGGSILCGKDNFLCAAHGTHVAVGFPKRISVGLFGGEGFILQKLEGDGLAFIHACGAIIRRALAEGETLRVDAGCVVAFSGSVKFDIGTVGGVKTSLFGGAGIFFATLTGPGVCWIQSVPFHRFALKLQEEMPTPPPQARRGS